MRIEGKRHKELELENKKKEKDWRESMDVVAGQYGIRGWHEELKFRQTYPILNEFFWKSTPEETAKERSRAKRVAVTV